MGTLVPPVFCGMRGKSRGHTTPALALVCILFDGPFEGSFSLLRQQNEVQDLFTPSGDDVGLAAVELLGTVSLQIDGMNPDVIAGLLSVLISDQLDGTMDISCITFVVGKNDDAVGLNLIVQHLLEGQEHIRTAVAAGAADRRQDSGPAGIHTFCDLIVERIEMSVLADPVCDHAQEHGNLMAAD